MKKIMLDAGHFGYRNQSPVVADYYESRQMWKLHLYLKEELENYGFTVLLTRSDINKDLAVTKRGELSRGCDLFLSLHSNAVGGSGGEKVDRVDVYYAYDDLNSASRLGRMLSNAIAKCMEIQTANIKTRKSEKGDWEYYGVMRGARSVGCPLYYILEHSFHTNKRSAEWLLQEENLKKLAKAEAKTIADYYGIFPKSLLGDINQNGRLDAMDYLLLKRICLETYLPSPEELRLADVNGDGRVDKEDYVLLKRMILNGE